MFLLSEWSSRSTLHTRQPSFKATCVQAPGAAPKSSTFRFGVYVEKNKKTKQKKQ
jgi:hypothetical protein